jgi:hypothetical protein
MIPQQRTLPKIPPHDMSFNARTCFHFGFKFTLQQDGCWTWYWQLPCIAVPYTGSLDVL